MIFSATELDTVPHLYQSAIGCRNARVLPDINEIRRKNAERLLASNFNGNRVAMADALETQPSFLGRLLNANAAQRRNIGDSLARRIEQLCRREPNWLDHDHDRAPDDDTASDPIEEIDRLMKLATPRTKASLQQIAEAASAGRLTEADCELLASIAARLAQ